MKKLSIILLMLLCACDFHSVDLKARSRISVYIDMEPTHPLTSLLREKISMARYSLSQSSQHADIAIKSHKQNNRFQKKIYGRAYNGMIEKISINYLDDIDLVNAHNNSLLLSISIRASEPMSYDPLEITSVENYFDYLKNQILQKSTDQIVQSLTLVI